MAQKQKKKKTRKPIWLVSKSGHRMITFVNSKKDIKDMKPFNKHDPVLNQHTAYTPKPYK